MHRHSACSTVCAVTIMSCTDIQLVRLCVLSQQCHAQTFSLFDCVRCHNNSMHRHSACSTVCAVTTMPCTDIQLVRLSALSQQCHAQTFSLFDCVRCHNNALHRHSACSTVCTVTTMSCTDIQLVRLCALSQQCHAQIFSVFDCVHCHNNAMHRHSACSACSTVCAVTTMPCTDIQLVRLCALLDSGTQCLCTVSTSYDHQGRNHRDNFMEEQLELLIVSIVQDCYKILFKIHSFKADQCKHNNNNNSQTNPMKQNVINCFFCNSKSDERNNNNILSQDQKINQFNNLTFLRRLIYGSAV
jgi:hypothetical protein